MWCAFIEHQEQWIEEGHLIKWTHLPTFMMLWAKVRHRPKDDAQTSSGLVGHSICRFCKICNSWNIFWISRTFHMQVLQNLQFLFGTVPGLIFKFQAQLQPMSLKVRPSPNKLPSMGDFQFSIFSSAFNSWTPLLCTVQIRTFPCVKFYRTIWYDHLVHMTINTFLNTTNQS